MAAAKSGINKVGNSYYQTITTDKPDGSVGTTMYRVNADGSGGVPIYDVDKPAGSNSLVKSFGANATEEEKKQLINPSSQLSQVRSQQITSSNPYGDNPTAEQKQAINSAAGKSNQAQNTEGGEGQGGNTQPTDDAKKDFQDEQNAPLREGSRLEYGNVKYPLDLSSENQDCIKFSILEYRPSLAPSSSGATGSSSTGISRGVTIDSSGNPTVGTKILGTITLPIPAGINDSNQVSWQEDTLNDLQKAAGDIASRFMIGGAEAAKGALDKAGNQVEGGIQSGELQQGLAGKIASFAVGTDKLQQRAFGSIFNNNLELLFTSPSLRSFSFTFKLSPRNAKEAKEIMKIIRFFKQAMSVKRSKASLLLKSPRTFAISYLTSNKQHPYLNKFKECALTNFSVDYTPEGQYMTYMSSNIDERSMISYNITLQFQELEPVFDDEYRNEQTITNIGY